MSGKNIMNAASGSGANNSRVGTEAEQLARRLEDVQVPISNISRIMRCTLPTGARIDDETKETIQRLVNYYIHRIAKKANEHCHREQRKTVSAEDVLWAMNDLGLDNYVGLLTRSVQKYREQNFMGYLRPNMVRPNFELALSRPTLPPPVLTISNPPISGYVYPRFQPNVLFYDPATAAMIQVRNEDMRRNDEGSAESSSSSAPNHGGLPAEKQSDP